MTYLGVSFALLGFRLFLHFNSCISFTLRMLFRAEAGEQIVKVLQILAFKQFTFILNRLGLLPGPKMIVCEGVDISLFLFRF